jgi:hypothetical protein
MLINNTKNTMSLSYELYVWITDSSIHIWSSERLKHQIFNWGSGAEHLRIQSRPKLAQDEYLFI